MSIKQQISEMESLNLEIQNNNKRNAILRKRKKEIELEITKYLSSKGQDGLKYNGQAILVENKEKRTTKGKKQKNEDVISLLKNRGIDNPTELYESIQNAQKNSPIQYQGIKIKKLVK